MERKQQILAALQAFAEQRPGIEPGNYSDLKSYRSESRAVTRDLHQARALIRYASLYGVTDAQLEAGFRAYSGRLTLQERMRTWTADSCPGKPCAEGCDHTESLGFALDYCTGQYFPTEFRKAVCAVLGTAFFYWARATLDATGKPFDGYDVRKQIRSVIGPRLQRRWAD